MRAIRQSHDRGIVGCDPAEIRIEREDVEVNVGAGIAGYPVTADFMLAPPVRDRFGVGQGELLRVRPHAWDGDHDVYDALAPSVQAEIVTACIAHGELLAAELGEITFEDTIG